MKLKKILLVDDSQPFNFLSRVVLRENKIECTVEEAHNGRAALDYLIQNEHWPEVILLDINMPVMDGFQFLEEYEKMDKNGKSTKIFMLTSSNRDEDRERTLSFDAVEEYFDKPLNHEHIKKIISIVQSN